MAKTVPELRQEVDAAAAELNPILRGLIDQSRATIKPTTLDRVQADMVPLNKRANLLKDMANALDAVERSYAALLADGHPTLPQFEVPDAIYAELQEQLADTQAAIARYKQIPPAETVTINLGEPQAKP